MGMLKANGAKDRIGGEPANRVLPVLLLTECFDMPSDEKRRLVST
jgi:hypothetical protein